MFIGLGYKLTPYRNVTIFGLLFYRKLVFIFLPGVILFPIGNCSRKFIQITMRPIAHRVDKITYFFLAINEQKLPF